MKPCAVPALLLLCLLGPTVHADATQHTQAMYRDPTNNYGAGMIERK